MDHKPSTTPFSIVLLGTGRVATHLGRALRQAGHEVRQIFGHTPAPASALAGATGGRAVFRTEELDPDAQIYLFAWKDDLLPRLIPLVARHVRTARTAEEKPLFLHTAGSLPLDVFASHAEDCGILYPLQTFSKDRPVDFRRIPCFLEASTPPALEKLRALAATLSGSIYLMDYDRRRYLHVAAVFACNFTNHLYALAGQILRPAGIPFEALLPLIDETAAKVHQLSPVRAQTGPACRYDREVMQAHLRLLDELARSGGLEAQEASAMGSIYQLLSQSIHHLQNQ